MLTKYGLSDEGLFSYVLFLGLVFWVLVRMAGDKGTKR